MKANNAAPGADGGLRVSTLYVGADRRRGLKLEVSAALDRRVWLVSGAAIVGWCLLAAALARFRPEVQGQLFEDCRGCAAALFLTAGALRLAYWRTTGAAGAGYAGCALLVLGCSDVTLTFLSPVLESVDRLPATPAITLVVLGPVLGLLLAGRSATAIRSELRPVPLATAVSAVSAAALVGLALTPIYHWTPLRSGPAWLLAEGASAAGWAWLAIGVGRRRGSARGVTGRWTAAGLAVLALGRLLRAATPLVPGSLLLEASGLTVIAAGVVLAAAAVELCAVYAAQGTQVLQVSGGLVAATERLRVVADAQHERLHDARTAVLAALSAAQLLEPPPAGSQARLHQLLLAELNRLSWTLDPQQADPVTTFSLAELIEPLLLEHRLAGGRASATGLEHVVRARRNATAGAVANLLDNARRYAPGALVQVSAGVDAGGVLLRFDDDGPGIVAVERSRLLRRGERGRRSLGTGSGLGLYLAGQAVAAQHGSLRLDRSPTGGLRVELRLPTAVPAALQAC